MILAGVNLSCLSFENRLDNNWQYVGRIYQVLLLVGLPREVF